MCSHYKDDVLKFIRTQWNKAISILGRDDLGYVIQSKHTDWHRSEEGMKFAVQKYNHITYRFRFFCVFWLKNIIMWINNISNKD